MIRNKKCPSCGKGFNMKSKIIMCKGCDSLTHDKRPCISNVINASNFFCKSCKPDTQDIRIDKVEYMQESTDTQETNELLDLRITKKG